MWKILRDSNTINKIFHIFILSNKASKDEKFKGGLKSFQPQHEDSSTRK